MEIHPERVNNYKPFEEELNFSGLTLPVREFEWVPEEDVMGLNITQVADDVSEGYIPEVDLEYPKELHDLHNDYPLASENVVIIPDMLSSYPRHLAEDLEYKPGEVKKLLPNLSSLPRTFIKTW